VKQQADKVFLTFKAVAFATAFFILWISINFLKKHLSAYD